MPKLNPNKIVISRSDSIGDVVLTLPIAGILKEKFPEVEIVFLGNTYTAPIIKCSVHVNDVWEWREITQWSYDEQVKWLKEQNVDTFLHIFPRKEIARFAKKAGVKHRIGTSHRSFHLITCNHLLNFTRKRSELHEAQLNTKLLAPLDISSDYSLEQLTNYVGFNNVPELPERLVKLLDPAKKLVILHPKSQGSAVEWGVENFMKLASELDVEKHQIFITGTEKEAESFRDQIPEQSNILDLSGQLTLDELISFIKNCDVLVAASTGPLHIAGVSGIHAIGLFADVRPIHPGRWMPLGTKVTILKSEKNSPTTQPLNIDFRDVLRAVES